MVRIFFVLVKLETYFQKLNAEKEIKQLQPKKHIQKWEQEDERRINLSKNSLNRINMISKNAIS